MKGLLAYAVEDEDLLFCTLSDVIFDNLLKSFKVDEKAIENIYVKFRKVLPQWYDFIDISFLPEPMKAQHKQLIAKRSAILNA